MKLTNFFFLGGGGGGGEGGGGDEAICIIKVKYETNKIYVIKVKYKLLFIANL